MQRVMHGVQGKHRRCWCLLVLLLAAESANCQLSKPVAADKHWEEQVDNKFLQRTAENDKEDTQFEEFAATEPNICPLDIELKWMTEVSSSVYATPLITDLYADGRKDIIVPGFVHYTDVLEGPDGAKALGWPGFHRSNVHTSPLLYDIDMDGIRDVVVATYDGEVVFFKDNGEQLLDKLYIPRLRLRKKWYVGLNPDPVDHSHPDIGKAEGAENPFAHAAQEVAGHRLPPPPPQQQAAQPTGIPVQPLPQPAQQQQQPAGAQAPVLPQLPSPPAVQPQPQPQQQPQPRVPIDMSAVLKVKERIDGFARQFGQEAANKELDTLRHINKPMFDAVSAMLAQSKELEQIAAGAQPSQGTPTRRLMLSEGGDGSSSSDDRLVEPFALSASGSSTSRQLLQTPGSTADGAAAGGAAGGTAGGVSGTAQGVEADPNHATLTQEALESFKIFEGPPADADSVAGEAGAGGAVAGAGGDADSADSRLSAEEVGVAGEQQGLGDAADLVQQEHHIRDDVDEFGDAWNANQWQEPQGTDGQGPADVAGTPDAPQPLWSDESFIQAAHEVDAGYVYVDAHVLCTPAIADIDGDGQEDLVMAVSYFYDKDYYDDPAHANEVEKDVDKDKYVAGGIVVFDLRTRLFKWQQHLDLTTAATKFTAHMFSSPTLVDLDADGKMEIIVGTSVGFVYVLDHKGNTWPGWPVQMGEVQGQLLVADLNSDGQVEIFAGDTLGNVALLDIHGKEIWEKHVKSMLGQAAVAGDIDGDGLLEIVFGTVDGKVHAIKGTDGSSLPNFPFQTGHRVQAQATIAPLSPHQPNVQHILVMSFDGFLYAINGKSGCAHAVDIGEHSYAAVLVDDLCGDGNLELLVSTMNGNVYMLQTRAPYHPLKTWSSQVQGVNGLVARWNYLGFAATVTSRQLRDVAGQDVQVQVEVTDQRVLLQHGMPVEDPPRGPYNVTVVLKGVGIAEMNAGPQPVIGLSDLLPKPGKATMLLPTPKTRTTAALHLDLVTQHRLHYEDEFVLSFHMHFHKLLKWLIAVPLLAMAVVVLIVGQSTGYESKSYHLG